MKLYYSPGACSLSPHIAALEAGLPVTLEKVDLQQHKLANGEDFNAVNSKGSVPVLELDDGQRLTEGPAIVQYIGDQRPASKVVPAAGTLERYRVQEWLNFITSEIHKSFAPLFTPDAAKEAKEFSLTNLKKRLDWLNTQLGSKPYLMGEQFTVADGYLFTVLSWTPKVGVDLAPYPQLQAYLKRVGERPKVKEALKAEGLA